MVIYDQTSAEKAELLEEELWNKNIFNQNLEIRAYAENYEILEDFQYNKLGFDLAILPSSPYSNTFLNAVLNSSTKFCLITHYTPAMSLQSKVEWRFKTFGEHLLGYRDLVETMDV